MHCNLTLLLRKGPLFLGFVIAVALLLLWIQFANHKDRKTIKLVSIQQMRFKATKEDSIQTPKQSQSTTIAYPKVEAVLDPVDFQRKCSFANCFNLSKCNYRTFKFYVYPESGDLAITNSFRSILRVLRLSKYFTSIPDEACLFIPAVDTLNRDKLSGSFVSKETIMKALRDLPYWNMGENHLLFNLYSGTFPDYEEFVDFDSDKAMLAKASLSTQSYRKGFDISLPLIREDHPEVEMSSRFVKHSELVKKKYLMTFKGKRYVYGIGSETRNQLYHLHNNKDMIIVTTCRHGKSWEKLQDWRCSEDEREYQKYDYSDLMFNSTFCLVPRGRRLGSFRFLESLEAGCMPVSLSNGYILPFQEAIDWKKAIFVADEHSLFQLPFILRDMSPKTIHSMRQQSKILWERNFSSVKAIVDTTLEIIRQRIKPSH